MKRLFSSFGIALLVLCHLSVGQAAETRPIHLSFASQEIGSAWYVMAANMAQVVRESLPAGSTIDVLPYGGGNGSCIMVDQNKAQLAIVFNVGAYWGVKGIQAFDKPLPKLLGLVGGLDQYYQAVVIRADLGITSLKEVKEKKMPIRLHTVRPNGTGETGAKLLLAAYGISYDDIKAWGGSVEQTTRTATTTAFQDGRADVFIHSINKGHPAVSEMAFSVPLKFLSIEPEIITKMKEYGYSDAVMPKGLFKGQDGEVRTPGLSSVIVVGESMPEMTAYLLTKGFCENKEKLTKGHVSFEDFQPQQAWKLEKAGAPLHPGAARYFKERKWMP